MRGKFVIVTIFLVALIMAAFGWWWNYNRSAKCRQFYGVEAARAIRQLKDVVAMQPVDGVYITDSPGRFRISGRTFDSSLGKRITGQPGLLHAANSLIVDESYDWSIAPRAITNVDQFDAAVQFRDGSSTTTVLLDYRHHRLGYLEGRKTAVLDRQIMEGWHDYLKRVFGEEK